MISMDKKYKTKSGIPVRILAVNIGGDYPVVAVINEGAHQFTAEGLFFSGGGSDRKDLVEVTPYDDLEIDDKVIVTFLDGTQRYSYFAGIEDDCPLVFTEGATSFTYTSRTICKHVVPYNE